MNNLSKEQVVNSYMINDKKVIAEMLYETIERYENKISILKKEFYTLAVSLKDGSFIDKQDMDNLTFKREKTLFGIELAEELLKIIQEKMKALNE